MKKRLLFALSFSSLLTIGLTLAVLNHSVNSFALATNNTVYYHYQAISPTGTRHGSKEFWMNCSTLSPVLEEPDSVNIFEGTSFDTLDAFFDLEPSDVRYIPPTSSSPIIEDSIATYGIYPQTVVENSDLISNLDSNAIVQTNGWYKYKGEYYSKINAKIFNTDSSLYKFESGTTIVNGKSYWFKCEPIKWKVLSNQNGTAFLLSQKIIDNRKFHDNYSERTIDGKTIQPNNYKYSSLRSWLNGFFYDSAFIFNKSYIQTTSVNNAASTTHSNSNAFVCDDTEDNVFLPSYRDYRNTSYGFPNTTTYDTRRCSSASDYTRASKNNYNISGTYASYGNYWTRSPSPDNKTYNHGIDGTGILQQNNFLVAYESIGVRPAITISIN